MQKILICLIICMLVICGGAYGEEYAGEGMPVVSITADSLTDWESKADIREATLEFSDACSGLHFTTDITIRIQGTSSLWYEKKNFTIVMGEAVEMQPGWGAQREYCLKADFIDPTHACNVVSAKLAAQMHAEAGLFDELPNRGVIDGFPVWVILNGEAAGVYSWNIPKGGWMFCMDPENEDHIVMCCEGWTEGCMFMTDSFVPGDEWSIEAGPEDSDTIVKFDRLMDFVANSSDEEFVRDFHKYLNLDACLNYQVFAAVANAYDNVGKNMLMVTWDGAVWQPMLYDLDSLWGVGISGMELTADVAMASVYSGNRLFERINELFRDELVARYAYMRETVLSEENIWCLFDEYAARIPDAALAWDNARWNSDGAFIRTFDLMKEQVGVYLPLTDAEFGYFAE